MTFNAHSELIGKHAFLAPSKPYWLRYSDEKVATVFRNIQAAKEGTRKHLLAHMMIDEGVKPQRSSSAFARYVIDGIGYRMSTEVPLYYSDNFFGHADTICFRDELLRIHDLKTGIIPASEDQVEIYAALFCHEYRVDPREINIKLAIYQGKEPHEWEPDPEDIADILKTAKRFDPIIDRVREEMGL